MKVESTGQFSWPAERGWRPGFASIPHSSSRAKTIISPPWGCARITSKTGLSLIAGPLPWIPGWLHLIEVGSRHCISSESSSWQCWSRSHTMKTEPQDHGVEDVGAQSCWLPNKDKYRSALWYQARVLFSVTWLNFLHYQLPKSLPRVIYHMKNLIT